MTVIQRVGGLGVSTSGAVGLLASAFATAATFLVMDSPKGGL
jgi:hypothetical protein